MLINHETPIDLLETSLTFNDYEFILPMFYKKYPKYKEFILKCRDKKRTSILDCGIFEGEIPSDKELIAMIHETQCSIFIVPDMWDNSYNTLSNAKYWMENIKPKLPDHTRLMIVAQCKTYADISNLIWESHRMGYDCFGLNHSSKAYIDVYHHPNPYISKTMGRIITYNRLLEEDIFDKFKKSYIHFLGINTPLELTLLNNKQYISSIDTSNPVILGIKGIRYDSYISEKPLEKLEVFMEKDLASNLEDIIFNINDFRKKSY